MKIEHKLFKENEVKIKKRKEVSLDICVEENTATMDFTNQVYKFNTIQILSNVKG